MARITLQVKYSRRALIGCACAVVCLLASGLALVLARPTQAQPGPQATYTPRGAGRHFYLTDASYHTDEALTACATGYHMASLWEIVDVSNAIYDYDHPAAHTKADSGYGPPSYWNGWVRTGYSSSNSSTTGTGNCWAWTSRLSTDYGVAVRLSTTWETAPGDISTWDATSFDCSYTGPVWCVSYVEAVYLPLVLRNY